MADPIGIDTSPRPPRPHAWWTWRLGSIAGLPVRIDLTLVLALAWIAVAYARHGAGALAHGLVLVVAIFAILVGHALGHAFAARRLEAETPSHELLVALVGPAINLALAGMLWLGIAATGGSTSLAEATTVGGSISQQLMWINVGLAAWNLIPALPMDGGRALRALLAPRLGRDRATSVVAALGKLVAVVIGCAGLVDNSPFLVVIAIVVWFAASPRRAVARFGSRLAGVPVSAAMLRRVETLRPDQSIEDAAALLLSGRQHQLPIIDQGRAVGVITRSHVATAIVEAGPGSVVAAAPRHEVVTIDACDPIDLVVDRLRARPDAVAVVVDHGAAVGVLTTETLAEYVELHYKTAA